MKLLQETIENIKPLDKSSIEKCKKRFENIAMPLGGLGLLQDAIIQLAGIQQKEKPDISKRAVIVFCADNGVVAQGVTQCGQEVTAVVTENLNKGLTSVCLMANTINIDVIPVDIGVARDVQGQKIRKHKIRYGTADMTKEPAMTKNEAITAIETGIKLALECKQNDYNLLCVGEMGIGNTTTTAAVTSVLLGLEPETVTGRGAGLSSEGLNRKINAIKTAINLHKPNPNDVIDVLHKVGGLDICGMVGTYLGGAYCQIPVVADGVIACAAALCAVKLCPQARDYIIFSHKSFEPAGEKLLEALNAKPFIDAKMKLGEGTGAVTSVSLLDLALAPYLNMASFEEINIDAYKPLT